MKTIQTFFLTTIILLTTANLMAQEDSGYYFSKNVKGSFEEVIDKTKKSLKEQGFGFITEIEMDKTLKEKLEDVDMQRYTILGACNPPLAHQALQTELEIGLLLPCNVVVYEEDGGSVVSIMDPISMLGVVESPGLDPVANEARTRLQRVIEAVAA